MQFVVTGPIGYEASPPTVSILILELSSLRGCVLVISAPKLLDHVSQRKDCTENQFGIILNAETLELGLNIWNTIRLRWFGERPGPRCPYFFVYAFG